MKVWVVCSAETSGEYLFVECFAVFDNEAAAERFAKEYRDISGDEDLKIFEREVKS